MSPGCAVVFVTTLYDQLHLVGNHVAKIHCIMQGDNCVDKARENSSLIKQCHGVAEAMFFDGLLEQMPSDD